MTSEGFNWQEQCVSCLKEKSWKEVHGQWSDSVMAMR